MRLGFLIALYAVSIIGVISLFNTLPGQYLIAMIGGSIQYGHL